MVFKVSVRRIFTSVTILTFIGCLFTMSCTGPEGSVGPAGPQGEQGPAGPQGQQGEEGTANVIYSDWININWNSLNEATSKRMLIDEPRVQGDFMDQGTILMYLKQEVSGNRVIVTLPYTIGTDFVERSIISYGIVDAPDLDLIGIYVTNEEVDDSTPLSDLAGFQIRYILIPGGVPAKMREAFLNDYQAVKQYYGLNN